VHESATPQQQEPGEPSDTPPQADPPQADPPQARRRRRPGWQTILNISAVAGVVSGIVFGAAELISNLNSGEVPVDERLELVDVEFSARPAKVTVLEYVEPGNAPSVSPFREQPGKPAKESELQYPLTVTLRNPGGDPAVLTGVKLVIHQIMVVASCGTGPGGGVSASLNFDFRFPVALAAQWEKVNPQNFTVAAHAVDALSITAGPETIPGTVLLWKFSVFGVSKGGNQAHLGDGVGMTLADALQAELETTGDVSRLPYEAYVVGDSTTVSRETIRACAGRTAKSVEEFTATGGNGPSAVHPGVPALIAAYRKIDADYARP
jgi:hypothetical protein